MEQEGCDEGRVEREAKQKGERVKGRGEEIGVWMLWEREMRMYGTEGVGWEKGARRKSRCEGEGMHAGVVIQG